MARLDRRRILDTTTGPDTLEAVQRMLDELWEVNAVSDTVRMYTDLAVSEVCANIIEHSGDGGPVQLRMDAELLPDVVRVRFTDDGKPAPVDLTNTAMPDEMSERGRGLAIAHRVLDELSYRRDDQGNHWTLVRRLAE